MKSKKSLLVALILALCVVIGCTATSVGLLRREISKVLTLRRRLS